MCLGGSLFRHFETFGESLLLWKAYCTIWIPRTVFQPTGIKRGGDLQVPVILFSTKLSDIYPEIRGSSLIMTTVSWAVWKFKKVERIYIFKFSRNYVLRWFAFPAFRNFWPKFASVQGLAEPFENRKRFSNRLVSNAVETYKFQSSFSVLNLVMSIQKSEVRVL